jgi:hypothetical protein
MYSFDGLPGEKLAGATSASSLPVCRNISRPLDLRARTAKEVMKLKARRRTTTSLVSPFPEDRDPLRFRDVLLDIEPPLFADTHPPACTRSSRLKGFFLLI